MIYQKEIALVLSYRQKLKAKEDKVKLAKAMVKDYENQLMQRIKAEEETESGSLLAKISPTLGKASLKWKDIVLELKGLAYVETLLQKAKRPTVDVLVVEEG